VFGAEHRKRPGRFGADAASAWRHDSADPERGYLELRTLCRLVLERAGISPSAITNSVLVPPNTLTSSTRSAATAATPGAS